MSVCMYVLKRDISFPSDSKLTQHLPRYQFKFRIRTDYFGLVNVIMNVNHKVTDNRMTNF